MKTGIFRSKASNPTRDVIVWTSSVSSRHATTAASVSTWSTSFSAEWERAPLRFPEITSGCGLYTRCASGLSCLTRSTSCELEHTSLAPKRIDASSLDLADDEQGRTLQAFDVRRLMIPLNVVLAQAQSHESLADSLRALAFFLTELRVRSSCSRSLGPVAS